MKYKHTQIGYFMIVVTIIVTILFAWAYITARSEPPSENSGTNLATTMIMSVIILILFFFTSLQVIIDESHLRLKLGYGLYKKQFSLNDILSAKAVKNPWYYGWGIKFWIGSKTLIYNISGFDAVEIKLNNKRTYRIGTDEPQKLEQTLNDAIQQHHSQ